ncbi:MAG TPA: hypothetical protein VFJ88_04510 [Chthoniobacterales bacterium]|nr:hypothetical protein [Chthoniobacterales bacterium]
MAGTPSSCGTNAPIVRGQLERTKALILAAVRVWEAKRQYQG